MDSLPSNFDPDFLKNIAASLYDVFRREMIAQGKKPIQDALTQVDSTVHDTSPNLLTHYPIIQNSPPITQTHEESPNLQTHLLTSQIHSNSQILTSQNPMNSHNHFSASSQPSTSQNPASQNQDSLDADYPPLTASAARGSSALPRSFARVLDASSEIGQSICQPVNKGAFYSVIVDEDIYKKGVEEHRNSIIGRVFSVRNENPFPLNL